MAARLACTSRPTDRRQHCPADERFTFALRSSHATLTPPNDSDDVNPTAVRAVVTLAAGVAATSLLASQAFAGPRADAPPPPAATAPTPPNATPQPAATGAQRVAGLQALAAAGDTLPQGWSHAEINLLLKKVPHTVIYDHGRVVSAGNGALTLREVDGSVVTLPIDGKTIIRFQGQPVPPSGIRKGMGATSIRVDGGATVLLRLQPGRGPAGVQQ
ncbi:MAG: hypothetical protein F2663_02070 [Actinobacteria bacterium]|uniref:Unannotated protein n=1 Tax=freshwater metagenome TaxID=449393 RepID=A0A6J6NRI0_9ZZZZ|nr:hypothetical protein [Actinomycetota bacterium]